MLFVLVRLCSLTLLRSMVLNMNWCSTTGRTGFMHRQRSREWSGGEFLFLFLFLWDRRKELPGNKLVFHRQKQRVIWGWVVVFVVVFAGGELLLSLLLDREGELFVCETEERFLLGVTLFVRQRNREWSESEFVCVWQTKEKRVIWGWGGWGGGWSLSVPPVYKEELVQHS